MTDSDKRRPLVLFVDDEENILKSVTRLFLDEPVDVLMAASGAEALNLLTRHTNVAVIVSDQRMPGMSGAEFLEKARDIVPDAVRIVLTGYADVISAVDAINKGGAYRYISKPWDDEDLVASIRDAVSRHELVRENKRLTGIVHGQNEELKKWNSQLEVFVQQQTEEISKKNDELKNANNRLKKNFQDVIKSLAGLLELRDKSTINHSQNVSEISVKAALAMGLPASEVGQITVASLLHDIGKIGAPDILLLKDPETMNVVERRDYMQHSIRGQAAIDHIEDLRPAGLLIRNHHESYNGTGFPDRLKGDAIPLGSRIIRAADFFDKSFALSSDPKALDRTLSRFREQAGKTLDPEICRILEKPLLEKYATFAPQAGTGEFEIPLKDIAAGMVVSRDVRSGTGILLLRKGTALSEKNIEALRRYDQVDPTQNGVYVLVGKSLVRSL